MRAAEVNRYLNGLIAPLPADTVDRVIYGDPDREVLGMAVAWMPYRDTIVEAKARGANLLVVHEPTFYDHWDGSNRLAASAEAEAKRRLIAEHGITIIRCHDVWDAISDVGIPYAWGDFLGLGRPCRAETYYNVYSVPPQTALAFAERVAAATGSLGQDRVGFYGDADAIVTRVGVGTGCISSPWRLYELGADLAISVDDAVQAWVAGEWCHDSGRPLIVVNHNVAEEAGMATLAQHLAAAFPAIPVTHIRQGCSYRSVRGAATPS
ncbi:MAG: Nif3-like dinuclear metal center hexameric protein [Anaerolineae bacterium]